MFQFGRKGDKGGYEQLRMEMEEEKAALQLVITS
jgi:hypothetical protein